MAPSLDLHEFFLIISKNNKTYGTPQTFLHTLMIWAHCRHFPLCSQHSWCPQDFHKAQSIHMCINKYTKRICLIKSARIHACYTSANEGSDPCPPPHSHTTSNTHGCVGDIICMHLLHRGRDFLRGSFSRRGGTGNIHRRPWVVDFLRTRIVTPHKSVSKSGNLRWSLIFETKLDQHWGAPLPNK